MHVVNYSQVLNVNIVCGFNTRLSVQSVLEKHSFWIDIVKNDIGVPFVGGCENHDLVVFIYVC